MAVTCGCDIDAAKGSIADQERAGCKTCAAPVCEPWPTPLYSPFWALTFLVLLPILAIS